jgi:transposase
LRRRYCRHPEERSTGLTPHKAAKDRLTIQAFRIVPHRDQQGNAILYLDRPGIPGRYLPHGFALWATVYGYFAKWQQDGVFEQLTGLLRRLVREREGRKSEPPPAFSTPRPSRPPPMSTSRARAGPGNLA